MPRKGSVTRLLSLLLMVPLAAMLVAGVREALVSVHGLRVANGVVAMAEVDRGLLRALIALRGFGGPVQTALLVEADARPAVATAQREMATKVRPAETEFARLGLPETADLVPGLAAAVGQLEQTFPLIEAEAAKPIASRRLDAVAPNLDASHAAGAVFERASTAIGNRVRMTGPQLAELVELRIQAWAMRSAYGQQCSLLRPLVARGARLDPKIAGELGQFRGATVAAADRLLALAASPEARPGPARLAHAAVAAVNDANKRIDQLIGRLDDSGKPAQPAADWTRDCNLPFEPSVATATTALDEEVAIARTERSEAARRLAMAGLITIGVALLASASAWLVSRRLVAPLRGLSLAIARLSKGDLDTAVALPRHRDELHALAAAIEALRQQTNEARAQAAAREQERERAAAEKHAALEAMADRIETDTRESMDAVAARSASMATIAEEMNASSANTGASARTAAAAAAVALANARTVAEASNQLAGAIGEISRQAGQSTASVEQAVATGLETRATIEALNGRVAQIGAVAEMIREIATRTNLLALNATIEAARAGDAGKGFAVVAAEVKQLATQTARSTAEIADHIEAVRAATGASVAAVARIEQTIGEISAIAVSIAAAVEEQGAATADIARSVAETASAANEMTNRIGDVSNEAELTGARAGDVLAHTIALREAVGALRQTVIRVVRTATPDVDRRRANRFAIDRPCRVTLPHLGRFAARVMDMSEGGAFLTGAPELRPGAAGVLELDGVGFPLPFRVLGQDNEGTHVTLMFDEAAAAAFRPIPARLGRPLAA